MRSDGQQSSSEVGLPGSEQRPRVSRGTEQGGGAWHSIHPKNCQIQEWTTFQTEVKGESSNLKSGTNKLMYKAEADSQMWNTNLWLLAGKAGQRDELRVWDWHVHTTTYETDN